MDFPDPVIGIAVEPKTQKDMDKLGVALSKLAEEDPTFTVKTDHDSGQTIISGMGELHLDIIIDRLKREFNVECNQGAPKFHIKKLLLSQLLIEKFIKNSQEVEESLLILILSYVRLTPILKVKAFSLLMRSKVEIFLRNTFLLSKRVSKLQWKMEY